MRGVLRMKRGQPWRWRCSRSETFPCDYVQFHHGFVSQCYDMPQSGHGARSRKFGKAEENICREAEKLQWWFEVAARHGRGEGGALPDVEGDI